MDIVFTFEQAHEIMVLITKATSEGSGELGHPRSLARAFAVRPHEVWKQTKGPTKYQTSSPTGWLHMRVWRLHLRRTKSAIISWAGSFDLMFSRCRVSQSTWNVDSRLQWSDKGDVFMGAARKDSGEMYRILLCSNRMVVLWENSQTIETFERYYKICRQMPYRLGGHSNVSNQK